MSRARRGLWRFAVRAATETRRRPASCRGLQTRSLTIDGGSLTVRTSSGAGARGTAVVLIHGVIVSSRYLMPLAAELADDFAVVVPDLPGYGRSDRPAAPLTLASLADAAVASALRLGHERVSLVGNSFGAQIAIEAAIRHPATVDRIALIGPTTDPRARSLLRQYLRWQRCAVDERLSVLPVMARDLSDVGLRRAAHLLRLMLDDRPEAKLPAVRQPVLVVRGARDRVAPEGWCRTAAGLTVDGSFLEVAGGAHMPHWSVTAALTPVLRPFLAGA